MGWGGHAAATLRSISRWQCGQYASRDSVFWGAFVVIATEGGVGTPAPDGCRRNGAPSNLNRTTLSSANPAGVDVEGVSADEPAEKESTLHRQLHRQAGGRPNRHHAGEPGHAGLLHQLEPRPPAQAGD